MYCCSNCTRPTRRTHDQGRWQATLCSAHESRDQMAYVIVMVEGEDGRRDFFFPFCAVPARCIRLATRTESQSAAKEMPAAKQAGGQLEIEKGKQSAELSRRRGREPRGKLRRRNQSCSPLMALLQLWKPYVPTTGAGLGQLARRSC